MREPTNTKIVVFVLDEQTYGLRLPLVERVIRAVEVTPVPNAPSWLMGLINVQGRIVYVVNTRKLLGLKDRELELTDHFIVSGSLDPPIALVADNVFGVRQFDYDEIASNKGIVSELHNTFEIARAGHEMIIILNLDQLLSSGQLSQVLTVSSCTPAGP